MKNLLKLTVIIFTILSTSGYSQDKTHEILAYIPLKTYHYDYGTNGDKYTKGQGGNIGLVGIYRTSKGNRFNDIQAGAIRNSFGKLALMAQYGWGMKFDKLNVSVNVGLISGYKVLFPEDKVLEKKINAYLEGHGMVEFTRTTVIHYPTSDLADYLPEIMTKNGIIPSTLISFGYDTGTRFSPTVNFSPEFVNAGVMIRL